MSATDLDELEPGAELKDGEFRIKDMLDSNAFGIKYLAETTSGDDVILKEFYPSQLCVRKGQEVFVKNDDGADEFKDLQNAFLKTAESLVAMDNPNIAKVHQFFHANNTCYMVMEIIEGHSLHDAIENDAMELSQEDHFAILTKLIRALHDIHASDLLHRDIEPKNITLNEDKEPFLFLDFGTFEDTPGKKETRAVSKIVSTTNNFSAMEMRADPDNHAPAADIYALAASVYFAIKGKPPASSMHRVSQIALDEDDPFEPLTGEFEGYPMGTVQTIDMALSVFRDQRIRSASEWLRHLNLQAPEERIEKVSSLYRPSKKVERTYGIPNTALRPLMKIGAVSSVLMGLTFLVLSNN